MNKFALRKMTMLMFVFSLSFLSSQGHAFYDQTAPVDVTPDNPAPIEGSTLPSNFTYVYQTNSQGPEDGNSDERLQKSCFLKGGHFLNGCCTADEACLLGASLSPEAQECANSRGFWNGDDCIHFFATGTAPNTPTLPPLPVAHFAVEPVNYFTGRVMGPLPEGDVSVSAGSPNPIAGTVALVTQAIATGKIKPVTYEEAMRLGNAHYSNVWNVTKSAVQANYHMMNYLYNEMKVAVDGFYDLIINP